MNLRDWIDARSTKPTLGRREWLRLSAAGLAACSTSGWIEALAADAAGDPQRRRSCILLWMTGGPSQIDTFDPKPGHANGGPLQADRDERAGHPDQRAPVPKLARQMKHLAVIRSMSTKEGDHGRATFLLRTGYVPQGPIQYPTLGSLVAKELGSDDAELPGFVSIAPDRLLNPAAFGPGFLGPRVRPAGRRRDGARGGDEAGGIGRVGTEGRRPGAARRGVAQRRADARLGLLDDLTRDFLAAHPACRRR